MQPIQSVAIVGAGNMGSGIAQKTAQEEFDVQKEKILSEPETIIIDIDESEDKEELTTVIKVAT